MSNPKNLTVNVNRKVQLEQFEPISFGASLEVELEEGDDYTEEYEYHSQIVAEMVDKEIVRRAVDAKQMAEYEDE